MVTFFSQYRSGFDRKKNVKVRGEKNLHFGLVRSTSRKRSWSKQSTYEFCCCALVGEFEYIEFGGIESVYADTHLVK
jgi:hypothetical protein